MRATRAAAVVTAVLIAAACAAPGGRSAGSTVTGSAGPPSATASTTAPAKPNAPQPTAPQPSRSPPATTSPPATLRAGRSAWISVAVATLWRSPSSPRSVDARALRSPADVRGWLAAMTLTQRRQLVGRADTQALLGDRVLVLTARGGWARVVVPDQPTPLDRRGYPGWLPVRQLSAAPPAAGTRAETATVVTPTAWLRTDDDRAARVTEVSYGTRLPFLGSVGSWARVTLPGGGIRRVSLGAVARRAPGAPAAPASGVSLVKAAQSFAGLPYLWAGRSGFGFDCSGLTSLVFRVGGITIPRDADAQASAGAVTSAAHLAPGDLLFYATPSGYVHHVSLYAGGGLMVQSPSTGAVVETIPVTTPRYAAQYAGARRYLR